MRVTEDLYPASIARCQHLKVNGIQCGSPALSRRKFCYFHKQWHEAGVETKAHLAHGACFSQDLPLLEDANSIQVALMRVMYLVFTHQIDDKRAGLLLYALQTASANLRLTRFEPRPQQIVINRSGVRQTSLGDDAWYTEEFVDDGESDDDSEVEARARSGKARVDPTKPKPAASVDNWTGDEAMHGLKHAIRLMDEIEAEAETSADKARKK